MSEKNSVSGSKRTSQKGKPRRSITAIQDLIKKKREFVRAILEAEGNKSVKNLKERLQAEFGEVLRSGDIYRIKYETFQKDFDDALDVILGFYDNLKERDRKKMFNDEQHNAFAKLKESVKNRPKYL